MLPIRTLFLSLAILAAACAPQQPGPAPRADASVRTDQSPEARTLIIAFRYEPIALAAKIPGSGSSNDIKRFFNAALALNDDKGVAQPYLAQSLPQLNTDAWRVFPDGRMETTYRLRSGLTWHDGQPLTSDDFVFAWHVYTAAGLGMFIPRPQEQMTEVVSVDPTTVLIRWKSVYPESGALVNTDFEPLPRHILAQPFAVYEANRDDKETFLNLPYWSTEFVGPGPYRLGSWAPGSEITGTAFDGHALGRPKIDRIIARLLNDENTVASNMLAGAVQYTARFSLFFEHAVVLKREWAASNRGVVLLRDDTRAYADFARGRPEGSRQTMTASSPMQLVT